MSTQDELNSALLAAAKNLDVDAVRTALSAGADPNARASAYERRYSPLHYAAAAAHKGIAAVLVEAGAELEAHDHCEATPLENAIQFNKGVDVEDFSIWLAKAGDGKAVSGSRAVAFAAERGFVRLVEVLIAQGYSMRVRGSFGESALEAAAWAGSVDGVAKLVQLGAKLTAIGSYGQTVLHTAVNRGRVEVVRWLLSAGADANAVTKAEYTPLHTCAHAHSDSDTIVKLLLQAGSSPLRRNCFGQTPFWCALAGGAVETMRALETAGHGERLSQARLNESLARAVKEGHTSMVKELLTRGVDPMRKVNGRTLLQHAGKDADEIKQLLRAARAGALISDAVESADAGGVRSARRPTPVL